MSQLKSSLGEAVIRDVFGPVVGEVGGYLCTFKRGSFADIEDELSRRTRDVGQSSVSTLKTVTKDESRIARESLATLIQHNLVSFWPPAAARRSLPPTEYTMDLARVLRILQYPKYLLQVKRLLGDRAEMIMEEVLCRGQETASKLILGVLDREQNKDNLSSTIAQFRFLVQKRFIVRSELQEKRSEDGDDQPNPSQDSGSLSETAFQMPQLDVAAIATGGNNTTFPDGGIYWRLHEPKFLALARDEVIVSAVTRRIDESAGALMQIILDLVGSTWDDGTSKHFYVTDVTEKVKQCSCSSLKEYRAQYMQVLEEDPTRFIHRVGDEGGGAFIVNFEHVFTALAATVVENVVMEKFGSKALRIFKVTRDKLYVEESKLQSLVMMPTKDTKLLTYQLLENDFLQLRELRKAMGGGSSAPSKAFFLFYVDLNRVARTTLELCYKAILNLLVRQSHEVESNQRLLEKQERVESLTANVKKFGAEQTEEELNAQLQEVQEMLSPPETAQVRYVHTCLDKLKKASMQVDETVFVLDVYLAVASS